MIKINSVCKSFNGKPILEDISLNINPGEVYCLLGKNGAGKTTLLNLIIDLIKPEKGIIEIFNKPNDKLDIDNKKRIGVLREDLALIEELTGDDYINLMGYFYQLKPDIILNRKEELAAFFLDEDEQILVKRIETYSKGTKKKVAIISALLNEPDILILDEPFSGLDPVSSKKLISYLKNYRTSKRIILISSHNIHNIKQIATHAGIINHKKLIFNSSINELPSLNGEQLEDTLCRMLESV